MVKIRSSNIMPSEMNNRIQNIIMFEKKFQVWFKLLIYHGTAKSACSPW